MLTGRWRRVCQEQKRQPRAARTRIPLPAPTSRIPGADLPALRNARLGPQPQGMTITGPNLTGALTRASSGAPTTRLVLFGPARISLISPAISANVPLLGHPKSPTASLNPFQLAVQITKKMIRPNSSSSPRPGPSHRNNWWPRSKASMRVLSWLRVNASK